MEMTFLRNILNIFRKNQSKIKIPKIFHRIWIGGNPMPQEFEDYGRTWEDLHPDWEMKTWTDENMPELINQEIYDVSEIVLKSDLARFEMLYKFGGVYIDTDFECYKNIEPLINDLEVFSAGEREGVIGNAIMGSTPKNPLFKRLINEAPRSILANADYGPNIKTGPVFMTRTLSLDEIKVFSPLYFYPTKPGESSPPNAGDKYPEAYANHHWAASWVGKEDNKTWAEWVEENEDSYLFQ